MRQSFFFRLNAYLRYKNRARRGVTFHSPFIYELSSVVFESRFPQSSRTIFEDKRYAAAGHCVDNISGTNGCVLSGVVSYFDMKNIIVLGENSATNPLFQLSTSDNKSAEEQFLNYDMIIVSPADETEEQLHQYFETAVKYATNNSVFVMERIYRSPEKWRVWEKIKSDPHVTVTIDLYRMGIVFFRKESSKEDFIIKY